MKRDVALQDLSRDHYWGLLHCMHVARAGEPKMPTFQEAKQSLLDLWNKDLAFHFDEEDEEILPHLPPHLAERLREDHKDLRESFGAFASSTEKIVRAVASNLQKHIRWEEDELFPWLQANLSKEALKSIHDCSQAFRTLHGRPIRDPT